MTVAEKALLRFLNAMDKYQGRFRTLPHSCWCMLGSVRHRHWIVVADEAFVKTIGHALPMSLFHMVRITCALQLVHTLGDLSDQRRRVDRCPMTGARLKATIALEPLPKGFRLPLLMQWDDGVLEGDVFEDPTPGVVARIGVKLEARFAVSDAFDRSFRPTDYWLHFIQGEKLYFKPIAAAAAGTTATTTAGTIAAATTIIETIDME